MDRFLIGFSGFDTRSSHLGDCLFDFMVCFGSGTCIVSYDLR